MIINGNKNQKGLLQSVRNHVEERKKLVGGKKEINKSKKEINRTDRKGDENGKMTDRFLPSLVLDHLFCWSTMPSFGLSISIYLVYSFASWSFYIIVYLQLAALSVQIRMFYISSC
jgi:hypothetical protein